MRLGFQADGICGYYGYQWRRTLKNVQCLVWCLHDVPEEKELHALECIESEVVFAYRQTFDQWPRYQTEIHFHLSTREHRTLAQEIFSGFAHLGPNPAFGH
jgi:hypothetical protein